MSRGIVKGIEWHRKVGCGWCQKDEHTPADYHMVADGWCGKGEATQQHITARQMMCNERKQKYRN